MIEVIKRKRSGHVEINHIDRDAIDAHCTTPMAELISHGVHGDRHALPREVKWAVQLGLLRLPQMLQPFSQCTQSRRADRCGRAVPDELWLVRHPGIH